MLLVAVKWESQSEFKEAYRKQNKPLVTRTGGEGLGR